MKTLVIILDGIGDRLVKALGYKTPLQAASTPNLDRLASLGLNASMFPISPGIAPATEYSHLSLLGYDLSDYPGRAYLESLGEGVPLEDDEVVFRTAFISVKDSHGTFEVITRDPEIVENDCLELGEALSKEFSVNPRFVHSGGTQGLLILKGSYRAELTDADPFEAGLPVMRIKPLEKASEPEKSLRAAEAANLFMLKAGELLNSHPVNKKRVDNGLKPLNFAVAKWAGVKRQVRPYFDKHGLKPAIVASGIILKGLALYLGIDFLPAPKEKDLVSDIRNRLAASEKALYSDGYDFVLMHSKAPDEASHLKDPQLKKKVIEEIDLGLEGLIKKSWLKEDDFILVLTSDHATPCEGPLIHSGEAVPFVLVNKLAGKDEVKEFNEIGARSGALGVINGRDLMPLIINYADKARYFGSINYPFPYLAKPDRKRMDPLRPE